MPQATQTGQNQEWNPGFQPPSPGQSSKRGNKVSFDPVPGYHTKLFIPYLCCHSQRDEFQGWLGKKGLLIVRLEVIHPSWALLGLRSLKGGCIS